MVDKFNINQWFEISELGRYVSRREKDFLCSCAQNYKLGTVVQFGMPVFDVLPECCTIRVPEAVQMLAESMAFADGSLDVLLLPHVLECSSAPDRILAEAWRCLAPEGRLLLTGFNPHSLWRFGRLLDGKTLPHSADCLALSRLKRMAAAVGFSIEEGRFMAYVPPVRSRQALEHWRFIEAAGDRWWPHAAAVYGLVLVKRQAGMTVLPEFEQQMAAGEVQVALYPAKVEA